MIPPRLIRRFDEGHAVLFHFMVGIHHPRSEANGFG
jgi:hypothetical protein